ncbi:response regulator [Candidatus Halobeggiatoa sp. HSG11]|nr:response regulator [Candidatus Halobeggiatoa sp. HSG11]
MKNFKLRTKLLLTAIAIGFIPLLLIGSFALFESKDALSSQAFNQLESIREVKKNQLERFFAERKNDMQVLLDMVANLRQSSFQKLHAIQGHQGYQIEKYFQERLNNLSVLAKNYSLTQAIEQLDKAVDSNDQQIEKNILQNIEKNFGDELVQYTKTYDFDDLLLIAPDGHIIYTTAKRLDLGQNILSGVLKNTHLQQAFQKGLREINIQDFAPYPPANNQYLAFITAPIFHNDKLIGVWVLSLLPKAINAIVNEREGMGETGETYLVGKSNGQNSYRSNRIVTGKEAKIGTEKNGTDIDNALAGKTGNNSKVGSTGDLEITVYAPLQIPDLNWAILTTMKLEEILIPKLIGEQENFFAKYIQHYGYHDLFLIHPQGEISYTVTRESDYHSNILTGKYADSGLGQLMKKVLQTKKFGISDFAPYAPSNNEPAAFIAQPLLHDDHVELVVALQFSDQAINNIMQQRAGMGNTGETYIVGSDKLMRSNSIIDPVHHSLIASFANPIKGMVDTQASRSALAGETGSKIILDYRGKPVLSAYTPIIVGDTTWALIAEIDETEAFAAITRLKWLEGIAIFVIGLITLIFITGATKRLVTPLSLVNEHLKTLALGKVIDDNIEYRNNDEIGELVISTRTLKEGMKISVSQANAIATGNYEQKVKLLSEQDELGQALVDMTNTLRDTTVRNMREDWLKTGQAQLSEKTSGEQDITYLAKNIISFITTYVEAQVGLFYLVKQENKLEIIASYAYTMNENTPSEFYFGESLVGQAALEQKIISVTQTPAECPLIIRSGLTGALPQQILLLPFLYENELKGVIEIGSAEELTEIHRDFLELIMPNIGIAVNTADSRTQMQVLLKQSQQQSEELKAKQKEMQQSNEELQSQSEELQAQSEEMQSQQEELRQTNEMLEERTRGLEQQRTETQEKNRILEANRVEMEKAQIEMEKVQTAIVLKAEELELASKYKSEFLANMSHELRTPLNSLLILAQLLADNKPGTLNEKQIEYAKTINSAGKDLLTLINDILDLSKVEAGKIEVQWENVLLPDLLTTIEQKFQPIADNKELEFTTTIDVDINPTQRTDSQRVKQIINNLLSNAFKFTNEGSVKIMVKHPSEVPTNIGGQQLEPNKTIAISVIDSGIGIPKEKQQAIFEAFQQADGSTSRKYGGTGLGLSISRQLARLLGGELTLTSNDKGSIFTLYLPESAESTKSAEPVKTVTPVSVPIEKPLLKKSNYPSVKPESLPKPKPLPDDRDDLKPGDKFILFIEDDRKFSKILTDLSTEKGFKHLLAEDGITGVQLAEQYKPSAIILDVGLPELNGWSVMERLKDNPETRHIPVHFMSAADQSMDAKKMGAIGYLLKPVSMEKLTNAFKQIEQFLTRTVKNLLIVSDIELHRQKIIELVDEEGIQIQQETTVEAAFQNLETVPYDCIILDIDIEQGSGGKLLEMMHQNRTHCQTPIIVYTDRDLTTEEEVLLMRCSDAIPIKSVSSSERLLDEATLFLHQIEAKLPDNKRDMLHMVHDKEAILKNKKVLIVDDDVRNVFALATVLEENNMETVCAINGQEGLKLLEKHNDTAIILMDIMMPEMDGYEAMREIRKQPKYRKLPIIALTAKAMKDDKSKCIEAGANDYLAKPVDSDKLMSLMRVWLYR